MIGPNNWCMVKCATEGCESPEWLMHWPCEGSEEEIRNGKHFCVACEAKKFEERCNADPVRKYAVKRFDPVGTVDQIVFNDEGEEIWDAEELKTRTRSRSNTSTKP